MENKGGDVVMPLSKYEEILTKNIHLINENLEFENKVNELVTELVTNDGQKVIVVENYDDDLFVSFAGFDEVKEKVEKELKETFKSMQDEIDEMCQVISKLEADKESLKMQLEKVYNRGLWQRIRNKQD